MSQHIKLGRHAEQLARNFLISKGYRILVTNWRHGKKEIDIVCEFDNHLVIIEVKSRMQSIHPDAGEVVNMRKQRNLIFAAEGFIKRNNIHMPTRFDIISVVFAGYEYDIEHIENAFFPEAE